MIFNQAVVLMVSHFGSVIGDVFRNAAANSLQNRESRILEIELKLTVEELLLLADSAEEQIGDLIIRKDGISFQDMQSTHRAFKDYFGVTIGTDSKVRNIITAQACRHAIVHDGARANKRTVSQIRSANPRTIKPGLKLGEEIVFSMEEITALSGDMISYISELIDLVKEACTAP